MQRIILIGFAGLIGTLFPYWLSGWTARRFGETFPSGTLIVNLVGCFMAGLLFTLCLIVILLIRQFGQLF
jgi:fluoride exporter